MCTNGKSACVLEVTSSLLSSVTWKFQDFSFKTRLSDILLAENRVLKVHNKVPYPLHIGSTNPAVSLMKTCKN